LKKFTAIVIGDIGGCGEASGPDLPKTSCQEQGRAWPRIILLIGATAEPEPKINKKTLQDHMV